MRIAKDGKPFDIDFISGEVGPDEVEVIQFLRPDGRRRRALAPVGKELVDLAKDMVLSAEELTTFEIAVHVRFKNEPKEQEIMEIANNGPGKKSPTEVLKKLIKEKAEEAIHA
jgi:hypothetical protein